MKLLITGAWHHTNNQLDQLMQLGHEVVLLQNERDALPCDYESVEGVICNGLFLHHSIEKFTRLKYIQLTSAGLDRVPMDYIETHNIAIRNARGVYSIPMAEFALSSVLAVYKQVRYFRTLQENHCWNKHRGLRELFGKRVCIVGCGSVGNECAKRFAAMGCDVVGIDIFQKTGKGYTAIFQIGDLKEIAKKSDIFILTIPLTSETKGMVDAPILESLPIDSVVVNISRGPIIDTEALVSVLEHRPDVTAILDVFEEEPLPASNPLWHMANVVVTPHNSFVGGGNADRLWSVILNNLQAFSLDESALIISSKVERL